MKTSECKICQAFDNEPILDYYAGFAIIQTKNMKGHAERVMVVSQKHERAVHPVEQDTAKAFLFRFILASDDYDWTIMEPTHASIPEHWHLVASTLDEGEDQELIKDTRRIEIRFK